MNRLFRIIAIVGLIFSLIGIAFGYTHQLFLSIVCVILYFISPDEKKVPERVRQCRVFNLED